MNSDAKELLIISVRCSGKGPLWKTPRSYSGLFKVIGVLLGDALTDRNAEREDIKSTRARAAFPKRFAQNRSTFFLLAEAFEVPARLRAAFVRVGFSGKRGGR